MHNFFFLLRKGKFLMPKNIVLAQFPWTAAVVPQRISTLIVESDWLKNLHPLALGRPVKLKASFSSPACTTNGKYQNKFISTSDWAANWGYFTPCVLLKLFLSLLFGVCLEIIAKSHFSLIFFFSPDHFKNPICLGGNLSLCHKTLVKITK